MNVERLGPVTIYKRGATYYLYYRQEGRSHRQKIDGNLAAARATAHKVGEAFAQQRPSPLLFARTPPAALVKEYLATVSGVQKLALRTWDRYKAALDRFTDFCGQNEIKSIDAIDLARVEDFVQWLRGQKRARSEQLLEGVPWSAITRRLAAAHVAVDAGRATREAKPAKTWSGHRILADQTWLFGEEFSLSVDDESLDQVLVKHLEHLGEREEEPDPVLREDGSVDLILSRFIPQPNAEQREHLVIELKRPRQPINPKILGQIRSYAFAVMADERFLDTKTNWVFWAVSNKMTDAARRETVQNNRPEGLVYESPPNETACKIWSKTWAQIIEDARARLQFFQDRLKLAVTADSAQAYLQATYAKYLHKKM